MLANDPRGIGGRQVLEHEVVTIQVDHRPAGVSRLAPELARELRELDPGPLAALAAERDERGVDLDFLAVHPILDQDDDPLAVLARDRRDGRLDRREITAAVGGHRDVGPDACLDSEYRR